MSHTKVTGSFEAACSGLSNIKEIDVGGTRVDCKRVLELLPSMPWAAQLKKLGLAYTNTEGDIAVLGNLTEAPHIDMRDTAIKLPYNGDTKAIKKALPNCELMLSIQDLSIASFVQGKRRQLGQGNVGRPWGGGPFGV
mmetsp:Transcript_58783/g.115377  ORF Transcript_58783/g.115377 Transcript_58783/m.115377 type:complete len:138 (+) Transcript_58783:323-736(+)